MSKYAPLAALLRGSPSERVTLRFDQIDALLPSPLPGSARAHRQWWENNEGWSHSQARNGWLAAGWAVETVTLRHGLVTFVRR